MQVLTTAWFVDVHSRRARRRHGASLNKWRAGLSDRHGASLNKWRAGLSDRRGRRRWRGRPRPHRSSWSKGGRGAVLSGLRGAVLSSCGHRRAAAARRGEERCRERRWRGWRCRCGDGRRRRRGRWRSERERWRHCNKRRRRARAPQHTEQLACPTDKGPAGGASALTHLACACFDACIELAGACSSLKKKCALGVHFQ
jgi:hypothetical protein